MRELYTLPYNAVGFLMKLVRIPPWLEGLAQDAWYAVRTLRRRPGFTASVILILALGAGLVTAVFSVGYSAFLRPWPVPDPNSVVIVYARPASPAEDFARFSIAEFRYLEDRTRTFLHLALSNGSGGRPATYQGAPVGDVRPLFVSRGYLDVMRTRLIAGRGFRTDEHDYTSPAGVAVIGRGLWRRVFASDPAIVGQPVVLGKQPFTIIGVADAVGFESRGNDYDMIVPLAAQALAGTEASRRQFTDPRSGNSNAVLVGRLVAGIPESQAAAELTTLSRQFREAEQLTLNDISLSSTRLLSQINAFIRLGLPGVDIAKARWQTAVIAFVALLLVHVLACANAGNLLLARGLARRRELAIRQALGAGRGRLVRQLLVEAVCLSAAAGVLAILTAYLVPPLVGRSLTGFSGGDYALEAPVLGFCIALSVFTALIAGLAPALRSTARSAGPLVTTNLTAPPHAMRLRRVLLATQVALATALLAGAGLLTRAVSHAAAADPGFAINELQVMEVRLPLPFSNTPSAFFRDLQRVLSASGAPPIAFSDRPPLTGQYVSSFVRRPDTSERPTNLRRQDVSASYFEVTGLALLEGRPPSANRPPEVWIDGRPTRRPWADGPAEVVISARAARELWPDGSSPLGKPLHHLGGSGFEVITVVGVAADAGAHSMTEFEPAIYWHTSFGQTSLLVRDRSRAIVERVRGLANGLVPGTTVSSRALSDRIEPSLAPAIAASRMAWGISAVGLLLAIIGAFGVFAYAVEERRREIGIRLALGASPADVVGTLWRMAQRSMLIGLAAGLILALGGAQVWRRFLLGLSPFDPIAYGQIAAVLLLAAAIATWIPARRATRVDPAVTLRNE
jgi:predicted permease